MPVIQGEFTSVEAADQAVEQLISAGIPEERIRRWNALPPGPSSTDEESATASGMARGAALGGLIGGLIAGPAGLGVGATAGLAGGAARSAPGASDRELHLPDPIGENIAVDVRDGDPDVEHILRTASAKAVLAI